MENLSVEDVKKLSDAALGKEIAKLAGLILRPGRKTQYQCPKLKLYFWAFTMVQSLDRIAEVEKIVIEKVGGAKLWNYAKYVVAAQYFHELYCATPRQRAEACLLALQNLNDVEKAG